jgi:hypothetical protein
MLQQVPVTTNPNQQYIVPLNIDGVVRDFYFTQRYNALAGYWVLSIADSNQKVVLDSLPLITGNVPSGNLLGQFAHLGIGSATIVNVSSVPFPDYPNSVNLGNDFFLFWGDTPTA